MFEHFAYIDPGTGSFALQAIAGAVMGTVFAFRNRLSLVAAKLRRGKSTKAENAEK